MSDFTDDVLDGLFCQACGCVVDETAPGYPRNCEPCGGEDDDDDE
jgi:hypothetical protein